jgi:hypothetical protein
MKSGDLVKFIEPRYGKWTVREDVAEVFFFGAKYVNRSYKMYLEVVSESR